MLRKSRNMGQILAVIMTTEHDPVKAKTLKWALLSSLAREQQELPSALSFCHVGESEWPVSPEWQETILDRDLGYFYQSLGCRLGRWESCCQIVSSQTYDLTYTLFSDQMGSYHSVCWKPQFLAPKVSIQDSSCFYTHVSPLREEPSGTPLTVWRYQTNMPLKNSNDHDENPFLSLLKKKNVCLTVLFFKKNV